MLVCTLVEAWAIQRKNGKNSPPDDHGNPTVKFHGEKRSSQTHALTTDPDALLARKGNGKEAKLSYNDNLLIENRNGLIITTEPFEANGTAERERGVSDAGTPGRRQGIQYERLCSGVSEHGGHAARGREHEAFRRQCDRRADHAARRIRSQKNRKRALEDQFQA
jgi:hypothetical protein